MKKNIKINHKQIITYININYIKFLILLLTVRQILKNIYKIPSIKLELNKKYFHIQRDLNLSFHNIINHKIKIGIYAYCIKNGGRARITASLANYLNKIKIFHIFLFTRKFKEDNEYIIPDNVKRIQVKYSLIRDIKKNKIDILIYQLDYINEIEEIINNQDLKIIFYIHSSTFDWIYNNYTVFKSIYKLYSNAKFIISLVPFENDYLFEKWGIRSIYIKNFMTYQYNNILPSDLSSQKILMIGRGNDKKKRFEKGILSIEYLNNEISDFELMIISNLTGVNKLRNLVDNLNLNERVKFVGYSSNPDIYYKNSSLNIFPSISESFGLVLSEAKMYGIPSILLGLDYVAISNGGTIIIYDDTPETLSKEALKVLKNHKYKKSLSIGARNNMKKFVNEYILIKWTKIILSVFNGDNYYNEFRKKEKKLSEEVSIKILNNQINLLNSRISIFKNISFEDYKNLTFMSNFSQYY